MTNLIAPSGNTFGKRSKRNRQPSARNVVPRLGYLTHAARLKGLTRLKGILANRLPPVIEVIPLSGYDTNLKVLIKKTSKS